MAAEAELQGLLSDVLESPFPDDTSGYRDAVKLDLHDIPLAATALHKLARKFTKALMSRLGESRYLLHPALDDLDDWVHPTTSSSQRVHSQLLLSRAGQLDEHVDRGLFNLVFGTRTDLAGIQLNLDVAIPSYGYHRTVVLQWRLRPDTPVRPDLPLSAVLAELESVRQQKVEQVRQQALEEARLQAEERLKALEPTVAGSQDFQIFVKSMTGKTIKVDAHPQWTVGNVTWAIRQSEGIPTDQQRLVCAGKELQSEETLEDCSLQPGHTVHLILKLKGD